MKVKELKKIFFVGLGGAGQRHLRIFNSLLPTTIEYSAYRIKKKTPLLHEDFSVNNSVSIEKEYGLKLFDSLEEGFDNNPDLIVISTPSSLHFEVARKAAKRQISIFIEKPFSHNLDGFDIFKNLIIKNNLYFFISFQRRFHPYLSKIKKIIESGLLGKIITANFNVASYVPDWHPYENYKDLYACKSNLGGGVLLTEIHEIDLCNWYFGLPNYVSCFGGNYSSIKLDVEDTAHVMLEYSNFSVQINLCFMQKYNRRDLYIAGTKGYVEWNANGNTLKIVNYRNHKEENFCDLNYTNDDMFISQASYFIKNLKKEDNLYYLAAARDSLAIVQAAKQSIKQTKKVKCLENK